MSNTKYRDIQKMDMEYAITEMVEIALDRFTKDKFLSIGISLRADNYKSDERLCVSLRLIAYRPNNFTFIGKVTEDFVKEGTKVEYMSYHDSCWRSDGVGRAIGEACHELEKMIDGRSGFNIFNHFSSFGNGMKNGHIEINVEDREAIVHLSKEKP